MEMETAEEDVIQPILHGPTTFVKELKIATQEALNAATVYEGNREPHPKLMAQSFAHIDHVSSTLEEIGTDISSLDHLVMPMLMDNASRIEELYASLDALEAHMIPEVVDALERMDLSISRLEQQHASLAPNSIRRMVNSLGSFGSYFGAGSSFSGNLTTSTSNSQTSDANSTTDGGELQAFSEGGTLPVTPSMGISATWDPWEPPQIFDKASVLDRVAAFASASDDGVTSSSGYAVELPPNDDITSQNLASDPDSDLLIAMTPPTHDSASSSCTPAGSGVVDDDDDDVAAAAHELTLDDLSSPL